MPVTQTEIGDWACGPCSIANSLGLEDIGAKDIILKMIQEPSMKYGKHRMMYTSEGGVCAEDIVHYISKYYGETFHCILLNRNLDEKGYAYVKRIHTQLKDSLEKRHRPILEIRSFVIKPTLEWEYKWFCTIAHFNVLVGVQESLEDEALGFTYTYTDSITGGTHTGFLVFDQFRNFSATGKFTVDANGKEEWEWLDEYPFMIAHAPHIQLETKNYPHQTRVITVLKNVITSSVV